MRSRRSGKTVSPSPSTAQDTSQNRRIASGMTARAAPPRTTGASQCSRTAFTMRRTSSRKNAVSRMSLLSMFRTDRPTTSGRDERIALPTASRGRRANMRSSSVTRWPARSQASATMQAPMGITGMGRAFWFVLIRRMFMSTFSRYDTLAMEEEQAGKNFYRGPGLISPVICVMLILPAEHSIHPRGIR